MSSDAAVQLCPRCEVPLAVGIGALLESVCPRCQGRFLDGGATERVVVEELGIDRSLLVEMAGQFGGARPPCPACKRALDGVVLRGTSALLCTGCGGLWCEAGGLARLTDERYDEVRATVDDAAEAPPAEEGAARGWALVQEDQDPLDLDRVARAFQSSRRFTALDAKNLVGRAFGVLVDKLPEDEARGLQRLLGDEGIAVELVPDDEALALPQLFHAYRVDLDDDELLVSDTYDRVTRYAWPSVVAITAGAVGMKARRDDSDAPPSPLARFARKASGMGRWLPEQAVGMGPSFTSRYGEGDGLFVDLVVGSPATRLRFDSASFSLLSKRPRVEAGLRFLEGAQLLLERVSDEALAYGARVLLSQGEPFAFRNQRDYDRDLAWVAHRRSRAADDDGDR
jgi:Zn-finger nucleic acid-binding protein